jgi:hypothetical protein
MGTVDRLPLVREQIVALKAIGFTGVSMEASFPALYGPYLESLQSGLTASMVCFYSTVANLIRAQGMYVVVESQTVDIGASATQGVINWPNLQTFYNSFGGTLSTYVPARTAQAGVIAKYIVPDFFVMQEEPDTEAGNVGVNAIATAAGGITMFNTQFAWVTEGMCSGTAPTRCVNGTKYGGGYGPWFAPSPAFASAYTTVCGASPCVTTLPDFLDLHLFPIVQDAMNCRAPSCPVPNFQTNFMNALTAASGASLPVTISQTWMRKVSASNSGNQEWVNLSGTIQEAREAYSFFEALDMLQLQLVQSLSGYASMSFVSPFNMQSWNSYLTWASGDSIKNDCSPGTFPVTGTPCGTLDASTVYLTVVGAAQGTLSQASYTPTAYLAHNLIVNPPDTQAPSNIANLTANRSVLTQIVLSWTPSTDNVGVAGYHMTKNSSPINDILLPPFTDTVAATDTNTYTVQAFDLAGNVSSVASITVTPQGGVYLVNPYITNAFIQ